MKQNMKGHLDNSTHKPSVERVDNGVARFPVGGPRSPVRSFLRDNGFRQSKHSDKQWDRADGLELHLYGAGSMARVLKNNALVIDSDLETAVSAVKDWA